MLGIWSAVCHRIWDRSLLSLCGQLQGFVTQMLIFTPHIPCPALVFFLMNSSVMSAFFSDKNNKAIPDTCKKMCQTRKEILKILNLVAESLK